MEPFEYKNILISYTDQGIGTAVVLVHGFLENKEMFNCFIPTISQNKRVICIDLLGHGQTPCIGYIHTMEDQAKMINALLVHLNVDNAVIIGHSMGGYIALSLLDLFPKIVLGLVLLNSSAFEDSKDRIANRNRGIKISQTDYTTLVQLSVGNLFAMSSQEKLAFEIEKTKIEALKTSVQGYIAAQEGMKIRKNKVHLIHQSTIPMILILGKKDPVLNYEETKKQVENTSVALISFEDGHMSTIENTDELALVFTNFLRKFH